MRNAATDLASVHRYDPAANTWASLPNLTTRAARGWTHEGLFRGRRRRMVDGLASVEQYPLASGSLARGGKPVGRRAPHLRRGPDTNGRRLPGRLAAAAARRAPSSLFTVPVELQSLTIE
jgi:hypothetical protein